MSYNKAKEFGKMLFKEGSVSIVTFGITAYLILSQFADNPFVFDLFLYSYYFGLFLTLVIIFSRICLNQYIIARLKLSQLKDNLKTKNYEALKEDTLDKVIKPLVTNVAKDVVDKLTKKEPEKTPENHINEAVDIITENLPLIEPKKDIPDNISIVDNTIPIIEVPTEPEYLPGTEPDDYIKGDKS